MKAVLTCILLAVLLAGLFAANKVSAAAGEGKKIVTLSLEAYEVSVQPKNPDEPLAELEVKKRDLRRNTSAGVFLSHYNESADEIHGVGDRFVVIGTMQSHAGRSVAVIDPREPSVVYDTICFDPVMALDGKHIAFEK